jgi:hypothetical protein
MLPISTKSPNRQLEQRNKERAQKNLVSKKYMCTIWNTKTKMQNLWKTEITFEIGKAKKIEPRPRPRPWLGPALGHRQRPGPLNFTGAALPCPILPRPRPGPGPAQALPWVGRASPGPALARQGQPRARKARAALGSLTPRTSAVLSGHAPWERGFWVWGGFPPTSPLLLWHHVSQK